MSENCCPDKKRKSNLAKAVASIGLVGLTHSTVCPCIPGLLLKAGILSAGAIAPFEATNRYLVNNLTPLVSYIRGDDKDYANLPEKRFDRKTRDLVYVDPNREIANYAVEGLGWAILGGAALLVGISIYRNRRRMEAINEN